jgi:mRNA deadenylase 3'-5' endonuclease subunit Ccr4
MDIAEYFEKEIIPKWMAVQYFGTLKSTFKLINEEIPPYCRFTLESSREILFDKIKVETIKVQNDKQRYKRHNVGLICHFQFTGSTTQFCVATTHIHWYTKKKKVPPLGIKWFIYRNPELSDLKIKQSHKLLQEISNFVSEKKTHLPLIITGDFNSDPTSAVYELYKRGFIPPHHPEFLGYCPNSALMHPFQLESCYSLVGEPITNKKNTFQG